MSRLVALLALTLLPTVAFAQESTTITEPAAAIESPRDFTFELRMGGYKPEIDSEPGLKYRPYHDIFGDRKMWLLEAELDYYLFRGFGTFALGFSAGVGNVSGHGIVGSKGSASVDTTGLRTMPLMALAVYRFDYLAREHGIPFVPYGKVGAGNTLWWITRGDGSLATFANSKAFGGKWGYRLAAGLAFELNFLDPTVGREFDHDVGVNSVFLFAEWSRKTADNFNKPGLDLSGHMWQFGLAFEF